ncbi:MAG TPA: helix-turn-helix domain-containing protein [Dehalococcoidia bacterium]|jgi:excisionase family DNA binding protein|nr:helix-turn-helix domain-containing protein [Dehalococcoidia bacterium]HET9476061.1 helix-turn-helix domain-containing protein [Dehalococcoidia bacterium]
MTRFRDDPENLATRWITLGQACKLLGVNESTLRRWADAGHVRSFRTPGGHRRFSEEDLRNLVAGQVVATREPYTSISNLALTRIRRRLQRGRSHAAPWYSSLAEDDRDRLRPLGRRLVALVSEYLTKGAKRTRLAEEAREIGHEYGRELARDGMNMRDFVEAFTFFRKSLDETAMEVAQKGDLSSEEAVEVWELLSNLADQVLLAIAEAFDEASTPVRA